MISTYTVLHQSIHLMSSYAAFTEALEASLGKLDLKALATAGHDATASAQAISGMQGIEGLTLFHTEDLGALLSLNGPERKAKRYFVGNYSRASQIIRQDIRLGLYAPLRVLVYETEDGKAVAEFELPSTQFARFEDELIRQSGLALDHKLETAIKLTDQRAIEHVI